MEMLLALAAGLLGPVTALLGGVATTRHFRDRYARGEITHTALSMRVIAGALAPLVLLLALLSMLTRSVT